MTVHNHMIELGGCRPDWPFLPIGGWCGSALTVQLVGKAALAGITVTGYLVRVTNTDGTALTRECVFERGVWSVTFPASHFENYGTVKNGVAVFASGMDETGTAQLWLVRLGDLKIDPVDASSTPGGQTTAPKDVYHKSEVVDGVQHYKREVLTYSERQHAWGAEYEGDYVFVGGDFVPFSGD